MIDRFRNLIEELSELLDTPLVVEHNKMCVLNIEERLKVHIQYDEVENKILLGTMIIELLPGKFREKVLHAALKANGMRPQAGILGYSGKNNSLALFQKIPIPSLTGPALEAGLNAFIEKAEAWKHSVESGQPGPALEQKDSLPPPPWVKKP